MTDPVKWTCPKCNQIFVGPDAVEKPHGWPESTGKIDEETKAIKWRVVRCADATPKQISEYLNAKEILRKRAEGITAKGEGFKKVE